MLACARIGAVHSVVFGGFSEESLATRINNCSSKYVVTTDIGKRGGKEIPLKKNVDKALLNCPNVKNILVINKTGDKSYLSSDKDIDYYSLLKQVS